VESNKDDDHVNVNDNGRDNGNGNDKSGKSSAHKPRNPIHKHKHERNKPPPRTIQGELERVLSKRFRRVVKVVGAGRTDGGVHARGQAIHFDLYPNETLVERGTQESSPNENDNENDKGQTIFEHQLEHMLNRMLPEDMCAWNLGRTVPTVVEGNVGGTIPPGIYNWNAMRTSTSKLYSYRISVGDAMDPSERHHRWQLPWHSIDPRRLERVLKSFEGTHDFVCFAGALEQNKKKTGVTMGTVRTIHRIELVRESDAGKRRADHRNTENTSWGRDLLDDCYRIDIYLDGALYKMVRNIVGTAVDVCREWIDEEWMEDLLERPGELGYSRRDNPCMPAPPNGLTLERVFYPDDDAF